MPVHLPFAFFDLSDLRVRTRKLKLEKVAHVAADAKEEPNDGGALPADNLAKRDCVGEAVDDGLDEVAVDCADLVSEDLDAADNCLVEFAHLLFARAEVVALGQVRERLRPHVQPVDVRRQHLVHAVGQLVLEVLQSGVHNASRDREKNEDRNAAVEGGPPPRHEVRGRLGAQLDVRHADEDAHDEKDCQRKEALVLCCPAVGDADRQQVHELLEKQEVVLPHREHLFPQPARRLGAAAAACGAAGGARLLPRAASLRDGGWRRGRRGRRRGEGCPPGRGDGGGNEPRYQHPFHGDRLEQLMCGHLRWKEPRHSVLLANEVQIL
eukprot:Rhum_TRINITY_DN15090_c14_g1::Rhum_TRINITY_DN15090_c14_g1_i1::g.134611::m.134611